MIVAWKILDRTEYLGATFRNWGTQTLRSSQIAWRGLSQRLAAWLWTCLAVPVGI